MIPTGPAWLAATLTLVLAGPATQEDETPAQSQEAPLADLFRFEVRRIAADPLKGIDSAEQWKAKRPELQRQLREMIGLDPMPKRTPLNVEVRDTVERPDFIVETILFQSSPGLYVTGNLYRPKQVDGRLPAVLYVCGHARVERDGVIYGCKAHYQHHAAWYAANGYICLVVDTLQLGEVPGLHHGTYREGKWWWQSRGYTPAGIEAWNGIRAIDYLVSRSDVDPDRIGVTGRSGGGATSWYLGAIDDRLAAVIPVAGITDLHDHVLEGGPTGSHPNGVIEGHCDCMYMVNTYRWDFPLVAALVAPKPLSIENTDRDPIFPEWGVRRIFEQLTKVYDWYDATDRLGLVIGEGGHVDSEEIRHPSFAFMNAWLKGEPTDPASIEEPDRAVPIEDLKVLEPGERPSDARNAEIDETFVPRAEAPPVPESRDDWESLRDHWMTFVRAKVFRGWPGPDEAGPMFVEVVSDETVPELNLRTRTVEFNAQPGVRLHGWIISRADQDQPADRVVVRVLDAGDWRDWSPWIASLEDPAQAAARPEVPETLPTDVSGDPVLWTLRRSVLSKTAYPLVIVAPRGVGPSAWPEEKETHLRRRFALLGQTLAGMRSWDIRRALDAVDDVVRPGPDRADVVLIGARDAAAWSLWSAVFEPKVQTLILIDPPTSVRDGPAFLNLERGLDMPQALALLERVVIVHTAPDAFGWTRDLIESLGADYPGVINFERWEPERP